MVQAKLRQETWARCRNPKFYIPFFLSLLMIYLLDMNQLNIARIKTEQIKIDVANGFLIKTTGCRIPFLDPYDKSILKYVFKVKPFTCGDIPPLVGSNDTSLYIEEKLLSDYNISSLGVLNCCYQQFWRVDPGEKKDDNMYAYGNCTPFKTSVNINVEYVKVVCKIKEKEVYKDFHSFVPIKNKTNVTNQTRSNKLNVMIVGFDAISRPNFQRQLPLTKAYLLNELNAIEMIGYNKVADNTFPNLIPILTGQSVEELTKSCWPTTRSKFDKCPFVWKNYSSAGYMTAFAEDASWMGVFNYQKVGFNKRPTDYYWKTFNYLAEKEIGHNKPLNADLCLGKRPTYKVLLDYTLKFVRKFKNELFFGFFWGTSLSHDDLNYPSQGDTTFEAFFKKLNETEILNKTVLIALSDHGIRWGGIRSTHQGQLEERLPFLFFRFPPWFKDVYPSAMANLRRNVRRLTTPFDLHATLQDLVDLNRLSADNIRNRSVNLTKRRGISLFLSIPEERTCSHAGISPHWCTCQTSKEVDKNSTMVLQGANFIVEYMNKLLSGYKDCAKLKLDEITDARLLRSDDYVKNSTALRDYTIIVKTTPSGGLFEGTVRCLECNKKSPFELTGTISRLNLYGNTSSCMTDYHLKLYCYCGR